MAFSCVVLQELGGNASWFDRFVAQHIAVFYYFMTVVMYAISPRMAYHFSECVEKHAFETYDKFIKANGDELKKLPAPDVAIKYYTGGDLYLFGMLIDSISVSLAKELIVTLITDTFYIQMNFKPPEFPVLEGQK
ncbi:Ubiquinol oxidase 4 chloroplastic/chromoplastic [Bienertia sinuspersici]